MSTLEVYKILDQTIEAESYSQKLLMHIQHVFRTKKINPYEYERMVNILTCHMLITEDIKKKIEKHIQTEILEKKLQHYDIKI